MTPAATRPVGMTPRSAPTRTCVACRTERDKRDLVRLVRGANGSVRVDPTGKTSGRGAYLCADPACWSTAVKSKAIQRALDVASSPALEALLAVGPPPGLGRPVSASSSGMSATAASVDAADSPPGVTHGP